MLFVCTLCMWMWVWVYLCGSFKCTEVYACICVCRCVLFSNYIVANFGFFCLQGRWFGRRWRQTVGRTGYCGEYLCVRVTVCACMLMYECVCMCVHTCECTCASVHYWVIALLVKFIFFLITVSTHHRERSTSGED